MHPQAPPPSGQKESTGQTALLRTCYLLPGDVCTHVHVRTLHACSAGPFSRVGPDCTSHQQVAGELGPLAGCRLVPSSKAGAAHISCFFRYIMYIMYGAVGPPARGYYLPRWAHPDKQAQAPPRRPALSCLSSPVQSCPRSSHWTCMNRASEQTLRPARQARPSQARLHGGWGFIQESGPALLACCRPPLRARRLQRTLQVGIHVLHTSVPPCCAATKNRDCRTLVSFLALRRDQRP